MSTFHRASFLQKRSQLNAQCFQSEKEQAVIAHDRSRSAEAQSTSKSSRKMKLNGKFTSAQNYLKFIHIFS